MQHSPRRIISRFLRLSIMNERMKFQQKRGSRACWGEQARDWGQLRVGRKIVNS